MVRRLLRCALAFAGVGLALVHGARLAPRQSVQDLEKVKSGAFVKNGKQTSCGLGIIDNQAAFVSADCLDFSGTSVDKSTKYEVYFDGSYNGASVQYKVTDITAHPEFDAVSKANNIAIVEYNPKNETFVFNSIATKTDEWKTVVYTQQYLKNVGSAQWGTPRLLAQAYKNESTCNSLSLVYSQNQDDFTCCEVLADAPAPYLSKCKVPYATVYAFIDKAMFLAGIFSHAVVTGGSDLCDYNKVRTYFTLFANYVGFAKNTLNRPLQLHEPMNGDLPESDPDYQMGVPSSGIMKISSRTIGGDFYKDQTKPNPGGSGDDQDSDDDSGGLRKGAVIALAVCCTVGTLLLAVGIFFLVRWWRGHVHRLRDPIQETNAQQILADGLGGATMPDYPKNDREDEDFARPPPAYTEDMQPPASAPCVPSAPPFPEHNHTAAASDGDQESVHEPRTPVPGPLPEKKG
ncbi:hypothetical protein GGF46_005556 [Coemansia sp. RSA 552]|nr:hypothetical protein GGF46_005556 [Coemansia sp. RSA 552]